MKTLWPSAADLEIASDHQREKYALATARPVGVLGGNRSPWWYVVGGDDGYRDWIELIDEENSDPAAVAIYKKQTEGRPRNEG